MSFQRIFIANRGEIAVRIIRAAHALGMHTIQAYSEGDAEMLAVRLAKESICVGAAPARDSYLNIQNVVAAARKTSAEAIHPGYGFLSENADFARAVEDADICFIGPHSDTIERMGDKVAAKEAAQSAGVPIVPGSDGRVEKIGDALGIASEIRYPIMIKAAGGGGGRGIRIAQNETQLRSMFPQAQAEALAAFGDGGLYLERVIEAPRHIEVQVLGDGAHAVHCFERECSLQRRRQKVWEESGAICLDEDTRSRLCASAVALAQSVHYRGAGTVEYLYDERSMEFFFIEMNTRIQVEHPVTEMTTGIDLVQEMIRISAGAPLSMKQSDIRHSGHAIEVRINAEDPAMQFLPFPGVVESLKVPEEAHIRFDHFLYNGYQIPPFYDSLIGKMIVHGKERSQVIASLRDALRALEIKGIKTTIPLHVALSHNDDIQAGAFHTQWLEAWLDSGACNLTQEEK